MTILHIIRKAIKNKFIKNRLRDTKDILYILVDLLGSLVLFPGRLFSSEKEFSKSKIRRILIIRMDRIGDVVLSMPVVKALRDNFAEGFIGFLTTSYTEELLIGNRDINEVIVYERKAAMLTKIKFVRKLRGYKFDLAVVLSPYFTSALFAYLAGATFRIGYPLNGSGFLLTTRIDIEKHYKHEVEASLEVIRVIGVKVYDKNPALAIDKDAEAYAEHFFTEHNLKNNLVICIHPGGYQEHTRWMPERYAQVADRLMRQHKARVILLGSESDKRILEQIIGLMLQKPLIPNLGNSLQRLAGIIKKSDIFLGNNSGPMHISAALGTPVVAIFGAIHPLDVETKWAPYGEGHIVVRKQMECIGCHPGHCRDYKCMKMVTVEDVIAALEIQINKIRKPDGD